MKNKKIYGLVLALVLSVLGSMAPIQQLSQLPSHIYLFEKQQTTYDLMSPFAVECDGGESLSVFLESYAPGDNSYSIKSIKEGTQNVRITVGALTLKTITVNVIREKTLIPGGKAVGIAMRAEGALVVSGDEIRTSDGKKVCPAKEGGLRPGDVIKRINGVEIQSAEHLIELINTGNGQTIEVIFEREGRQKRTLVKPVLDADTGKYRFGIWVKDSSVGIGTLTYYDPATGMYASLGHPICDAETGAVMSVRNGELLPCSIIDVVRGAVGAPGEIKGIFNSFLPAMGTILLNCEFGLYGKSYQAITSSVYPEGLPIGSRYSVHTGPCTIITSVDAFGEKEYAAEIVSLTRQESQASKSMVIRVTDARLLDKTGGIVQGMSGSPVIQDGHIIGAVTHVFVNDPTQGYAVYIDWMLPQTGSVE
ncbi:MAG: SpoIVB peptidase [Eubacteriales bacterium]|nr:SpoIVB peptidase [Eubacteriales bacterium]